VSLGRWKYNPSPFEVEIAIAKLKKYKLPSSDRILTELIQVGGETLQSKIHKLINSIWNKEKLPNRWKEPIIVPVHKKGDKTDCSTYRGMSLLPASYKILYNILLSRLSPYIDEITGAHQCGFRHNRSLFAFVTYWRKKWQYNETVHQLFVDFKKACNSVRREVLYNILIEFGVPMKLVRQTKMCLNETYSKVLIGKYLSDNTLIQNCLKQGGV
jgi:hypothetical protein